MVNGLNWKELREIRKMGQHRLVPQGAILALLGIGTEMVDEDGNPLTLVKREKDGEKEPVVGFRLDATDLDEDD